MKPEPLPLTVIGGFLGAGKTTLLNRWLREAGGMRLAVLVNDFGAINIDAELIAARSGDAIALSNGCVCCQIGDDLTAALIGVLERREQFDAIVVEASGVSDPWRVAQFARADPALSLDGVIVLVDASAALMQARDPLLADTLLRQLASADLVVLNKVDLVNQDADRAAVRAWVATTASGVTCFETSNAQVPLALLTRLAPPEAIARPERDAHDHAHDDHAHHVHDASDTSHTHADPAHGTLFDTWSARPAHAFDADTLRAWLREPPAGLLRLKGYVRTADGRWLLLQFAGRHGSVRISDAPARDSDAAVVAIALRGQLPVAALEQAFGTQRAT